MNQYSNELAAEAAFRIILYFFALIMILGGMVNYEVIPSDLKADRLVFVIGLFAMIFLGFSMRLVEIEPEERIDYLEKIFKYKAWAKKSVFPVILECSVLVLLIFLYWR